MTIESRIAVLEEKVNNIEDKMQILDNIHQELTRYKGFIGGMVFLVTCIGAFFSQIKDILKFKFGI